MAQLSVQVIDKSPIVLNYTLASSALSGDTVSNLYFDDILLVKNDSSAETLVTISALVPCEQNDYKNISTIVSSDSIGFFPLHSKITNWVSKLVTIHCNPVEDIKLAVYRQLR